MAKRRKILSVVGTRPNFIKVMPIARELAKYPGEVEHILVHTGQHYDAEMSSVFFEELGIPEPDHLLNVGSGSHAQQTAGVMQRLEPLLLELEPDIVVVVGDVNSTLAAALVTSKLGIPLAHVEAGLRSFDRTMPEEINRVVVDTVSDFMFTSSPEAEENLLREGHNKDKIHFVGNTMIDTLVAMRDQIENCAAASRHGLDAGRYLVVTLHRPALVNSPLLEETMLQLDRLAKHSTLVFPVHPRTRAVIEDLGIERSDNLRLIEPLGYLEFLGLVRQASAVLTDSGGIQEETTFLGIPCFTLRDNTERPITVSKGTNRLLGLAPDQIADLPALAAEVRQSSAGIPPLWDGKSAERIVGMLLAQTDRSPALAAI